MLEADIGMSMATMLVAVIQLASAPLAALQGLLRPRAVAGGRPRPLYVEHRSIPIILIYWGTVILGTVIELIIGATGRASRSTTRPSLITQWMLR